MLKLYSVSGLRLASLAAAMAFSAGVAVATTPVMPPVAFPIDESSVASEISAAGAVILGLVFSVAIGFALVWKLFRRLKGAV